MKASDVMTRHVLTVGAETTLSEAVSVMVGKRVSGLPVVGPDGQLRGIFTEGDLLHRVETGTGVKRRSKWLAFLIGPGQAAGEYVASHSRTVADLMTRDVFTVTEATPLEDVVDLMERKHIRRVPVLREGVLVGIIARLDLVRALGEKLAEVSIAPAPATALASTDAAIEHKIKDELEPQNWVVASNITISVDNGVVTLDGVIYDDRCRNALRVVAQNVPGVKAVEDQLVWMDTNVGLISPAL